MANKRIYYAIQQLSIAPVGTATYTNSHLVHGAQSVGINTKFNLEQIFELGQLAIYENLENVPNIEVTIERVLDGYALAYHLATPGSASATLAGRSNVKATVCLGIYSDVKESCSGLPISEVECSGMFVSALNYNFPVQGNFTEGVTLVGNNKIWRTSGFASSGLMNDNDAPIGTGLVNRRQHMIFGSGVGKSILPSGIPGITVINGTGYNVLDPVDGFGVHIQSIKVSANLGRDELDELGRKAPYHRYVNFPVEVKTDIECYSTSGDQIQALEEADNLNNEMIHIYIQEGLDINMGAKNKLDSVSYGGGNAGAKGGNVTTTFSYTTFNDFTVKHPNDPSGFYP